MELNGLKTTTDTVLDKFFLLPTVIAVQHIHIYIYIYLHKHIHTYVYVYIHRYRYRYIRYIYTYVYIYISVYVELSLTHDPELMVTVSDYLQDHHWASYLLAMRVQRQ